MRFGSEVAIVDDDELIRRGISSLLRSAGLTVQTFHSGVELMGTDLTRFGCVISDIQMVGMSGLELQKRLKAVAPALPLIFITAFPDAAIRRRALTGGAWLFLEKPCDPAALLQGVRKLLSSRDGSI